MKTREEWLKQYPRLHRFGITDGDFCKREITMEAKALSRVIPDDKPFYGAEIGIWFAKTASILLFCKPLLKIVGVDNWWEFPEMENIAKYNLEHYGKGRYTLHNYDSTTASVLYDDGTFDYVFIDASKDEEKYYQDASAWFPKVKAGGYMIGHDVYNPHIPEMSKMAERALVRLSNDLEFDYEIDKTTYTWITQKGE